jgi:hypothetical protein
MKAFLIVKQGYEYNDEYYEKHDSPDEVQRAMTSKTKALDLLDRMNGKFLRENDDLTTEGGQVLIPFKLVEVEVESND